MKNKFSDIVALDIGSSKIAAFYAKVENNGNASVAAQILSSSEGIRSSVIVDRKSAESSIIDAIYNLEKESNINVRNVLVSLSGTDTKSYYIYNRIKVNNSQVTHQEVKRLIQKILSEFDIANQEVIHYFPIEFTLDNNSAIDNPIGMLGKELGCRLHIITAASDTLLNIANCLAKHQIEVSNFVLASYAASLASLSEDEKALGCLHIEMGARTTGFCIYLNKQPVYTGYVPVGGWHITNDIAKAFSIPMHAAEKLKILFGNALEKPHDKNQIINLENIVGAGLLDLGYSSITVGELASIVNPRAEEILELVKEAYDKVGIDHLIARKIVISGGSSMLRGMKELASKVFNKYVRIAENLEIQGMSKDCNNNLYSTAIGMIKYFSYQKQRQYETNRAPSKEPVIKRLFSWLKENA
ncbi:MAG: ftsA [Rickettsiaceae bacterium]|jgi:cell division protein FtsA|nr:ftsA [Rickettsiaceae bacterium]